MTQKSLLGVSFDASVNVRDIAELARLQLDFKRSAKEDGNLEEAEYYDRLSKVYHQIANIIAQGALMTLPQIMKLPSITTLAIALTTSEIKQDIEDAEELKTVKVIVGDEKYKEVVKAKLRTHKSNITKRVKEFKDRVADTASVLKMEGFDLFALDNQEELKLRIKLSRNIPLNPEEEKRLFAKEIRETVCNYLKEGARHLAVDLLKNYALRTKGYSDFETHKLIDALKDKYDIKEPKMNNHIKGMYIGNFKQKWLSVTYTTKITKGNTEKSITVGAIGLYDPNKFDGIISPEGKTVCTVEEITNFRAVTISEMTQIEKILNIKE